MEASPPAATETPHARMNRGANRAARRFGQCTYVAVHYGVRADASVCQRVLVRVAVHMPVCVRVRARVRRVLCTRCMLSRTHSLPCRTRADQWPSFQPACADSSPLRPTYVGACHSPSCDVSGVGATYVGRSCRGGRCPGRPGRADVRRRVRPVRAAEVTRRVGTRRVSVREPARRRVPSPTCVGSDVRRAADVCRSAGVYRLR
jgi:hypothetical protein